MQWIVNSMECDVPQGRDVVWTEGPAFAEPTTTASSLSTMGRWPQALTAKRLYKIAQGCRAAATLGDGFTQTGEPQRGSLVIPASGIASDTHARSRHPRGFTMLEMIVAMLTLGVALTGLFPLVAMLSRDIQPIYSTSDEGRYHRSPGRNWESDGNTIPAIYNEESPYDAPDWNMWYLRPVDAPRVRRLGACATITDTGLTTTDRELRRNTFLSGVTPLPPAELEPFVLKCEPRYDPLPPTDGVYSETTRDEWHDGVGPNGDGYRYHLSVELPDDSEKATWTFTVKKTGWYSVQASWPGNTGQANDARFKVSMNGVEPQLAFLDQTSNPVGVTDAAGRSWAKLTANPIPVAGTDTVPVLVTVTLDGESSTDVVVAGTVRLVHNTVILDTLTRTPPGIDATTTTTTTTITAQVTVDVQIPK